MMADQQAISSTAMKSSMAGLPRISRDDGQLVGGGGRHPDDQPGPGTGPAELGIEFCRAKVGDRYVMKMLKERGWRLAENPGHVICLDHATTGGMAAVAACKVLKAMVHGCDLQTLDMKKFPQILVSVRLSPARIRRRIQRFLASVAAAEAELAGRGVCLLRKSGPSHDPRHVVEGEDARQSLPRSCHRRTGQLVC